MLMRSHVRLFFLSHPRSFHNPCLVVISGTNHEAPAKGSQGHSAEAAAGD